MLESFLAPFDWSGEIQMIFGVFLNDFWEKTTLTDVFVALFVVIMLTPHLFKIFKENPIRSFGAFISKGNRSMVLLIICFPAIIITVMLHSHGINGLAPLGSLGLLSVVTIALVT